MSTRRRPERLPAAPRSTPVVEPANPPLPPRVWDDPEPEPEPAPRPDPTPVAPRPRSQSVLLGLGVGAAMAVAGIAIAFSVVAVPLFALASIDPGSGLDRDLVRKGLLFVALPFGGIVGGLSGVLVGVWYGRGGRLPRHERILHER